jgi:hypothetical protein
MLAIFEEELLAAFDASRSMLPLFPESAVDAPSRGIGTSASRGLAGGANSIKHGLPSTTVAQVRARVRETIVAQGLEKSRDLEKVAPAIASATAAALADTDLIGTEVTAADLAKVNAITSKAIARSLNAPSVTGLAEGLGTENEKKARLDSLARAAANNVDTLALPATDAADSLHLVVLLVTSAGNADISPSGTGDNDPGTLLAARTGSLVRIAGAKLDGKLTGSACSTALNDLANAAVVGLGDTAIRDQAETKLQAVVQDGVLFNLFLAYYGFKQNVGLSATDLRSAIDFSAAAMVLGTGAYHDAVNLQVQATLDTIVPVADSKARTAAIISTVNPPPNELANATTATAIASGASITWTSGSVLRVTANLAVNGNLVIEPGVTVYIDLDKNITVGATGSIQAVGTTSAPIIFTRSLSGNVWGALEINSNSMANTLKYCDISGARDGIIIATTSTSQGISIIEDCLIHDNTESGLCAWYARRDGTRMTTVRSCHFYNNLLGPVSFNENVLFDTDKPSHFYNPVTGTEPDLGVIQNALIFNGTITANYRFHMTELPYLIWDSLSLVSPAVLTIDPGVIVKFQSGDDALVNQGARIVAGVSGGSPVIFTSYRDLSAGGDTLGQGDSALPGDWVGFDLRSSGNIFYNCEFRYTVVGVEFNNASSSAGDGAASFNGCVFRHSSVRGINTNSAGTTTILSGCSFHDHLSYPLTLTQNVSFDTSNTFHAPGSSEPEVPLGSKNAIYFYGDIGRNVQFTIQEVPYYCAASVTVSSPAILAIAPGVVIKFGASQKLLINQGALVRAGESEGERVIFTSYRDGSAGGDTAGQGAAGSPGDWQGLDLRSNANEFWHCDFRYATKGIIFNNEGSSVGDGSGSFTGCIFRHCLTRGFYGYSARSGTRITGSSFYENSSYPLTITQDVNFDGSNIFHEPGTSAPAVPVGSAKAIIFQGNISKVSSFPIIEVPYLLTENIDVSSTLTLSAGAVVKVQTGFKVTVLPAGRISAIGTSLKPIIFTSYRDGTAGGDTFNLGAAGIAGDWSGLDIRSIGNVLDYCELRYAVKPIRFNNYGSSVGDGGVTLTNSLVRSSSNGGIDATDASSVTAITDNRFQDNNANGTTIWDLDVSGNTKVSHSGNAHAGGGTIYIRP